MLEPEFGVIQEPIKKDVAAAHMAELVANPYPGRFLAVGANTEARELHVVAATMGRRSTSTDRIYVVEGDSVRTEPLSELGKLDPLTRYRTMTRYGEWHIASNGDQTDSLFDELVTNDMQLTRGGAPFSVFVDTMARWNHEPDPSHTPRITEMVLVPVPANRHARAMISIIRNNPENPDAKESSLHRFYEATLDRILAPGTGLCVHTYQGSDDPLQAFEGGPRPVLMGGSAQQTAELFAETLDANGGFLVSAVVKAIDVNTGRVNSIHVVNKFGESANFASVS